MKIYLAGPITNIPDGNFPAFHRAAERLRKRGDEVSNPAEFHRDNQDLSWVELMKHCIRELLTCDRIVLLPGWSESKGACVEFQIATALGITIEHFS